MRGCAGANTEAADLGAAGGQRAPDQASLPRDAPQVMAVLVQREHRPHVRVHPALHRHLIRQHLVRMGRTVSPTPAPCNCICITVHHLYRTGRCLQVSHCVILNKVRQMPIPTARRQGRSGKPKAASTWLRKCSSARVDWMRGCRNSGQAPALLGCPAPPGPPAQIQAPLPSAPHDAPQCQPTPCIHYRLP